jgi:hypothetical protein
MKLMMSELSGVMFIQVIKYSYEFDGLIHYFILNCSQIKLDFNHINNHGLTCQVIQF